jgi:hypothetical protein
LEERGWCGCRRTHHYLLNITRGKKLEEREEEGTKKMIEEVPSAFGVAFELVEVRY